MLLYRPEEVLRISGGWGSQISRHSVHEGGKVFSLSHRPPLPRRRYPWYSLVLEAESTTGPFIKHNILSWFHTFAVFWMVYASLWVFPRRLNFICRRFGTLFHLHRRIGSYPPMKMEQGIPKRRYIKFRRRGIAQKRARNNIIYNLLLLLYS